MTDDHLGMLPEGDRNRAGSALGTKPISPPYANSAPRYAVRLILGPPAFIAIAPLGSDPAAIPGPPWVIIWNEDGSGWAGPGFTRRNDESAPPTLDAADLLQGDDDHDTNRHLH